MNVKKGRKLKFLKWTLLGLMMGALLTISGFVYYLETSIDRVMTKERRDKLIGMINDSPALPESFYNTYNKYYPGAFDRTVWGSVGNQLLGRHKWISSQPRDLYIIWYADKKNRPQLSPLILALEIEEHCSNKKCFEFGMSTAYFGYNTRSIAEASKFYYKKDLSYLSEKEILELLIIEKAPSFYNPVFHKERLNAAVKTLMDKAK